MPNVDLSSQLWGAKGPMPCLPLVKHRCLPESMHTHMTIIGDHGTGPFQMISIVCDLFSADLVGCKMKPVLLAGMKPMLASHVTCARLWA